MWQLGLQKLFGQKRLRARWKLVHKKNAQRLYKGFVRLRGVYIKLGQILSVLGSFLPKAYAKELERLNKLAFEEDQLERVRLEKERETLRKRFDQDSADQEGVDPLALGDGTLSKSASKYGDSTGTHVGEKKSAELEYIDSLPYDPSVVQALESYMETNEFDVMLTELEKEIEAMAPSKTDGWFLLRMYAFLFFII